MILNMKELTKIINDQLVDLVVRQVFRQLTGKLAFLAWGPIGSLVEMCIRYVVNIAYNQAELFVTDKIVEKAVEKQVEVVDAVTDKLIEYEENVENYTDKEKDALDEELMAAYRDLFRF